MAILLTRTLADFHNISENYRRLETKYFKIDREDKKSRIRKPTGDWDRKFAKLYLEAIEAELARRLTPKKKKKTIRFCSPD
ncbi:hypothetical protein [Spirosoma fluviale]|uniref:Uncharacterized protein n=1 Tax=Spirosoma fluviale TaxID=1597977 RepID=A0A286FC91_9BACT|nr:hypothetical protein [Spirosoma fluviale]SOD80822.1 hypothetical protein SAMN06269250_1578 [Spirosoma fluviale]